MDGQVHCDGIVIVVVLATAFLTYLMSVACACDVVHLQCFTYCVVVVLCEDSFTALMLVINMLTGNAVYDVCHLVSLEW